MAKRHERRGSGSGSRSPLTVGHERTTIAPSSAGRSCIVRSRPHPDNHGSITMKRSMNWVWALGLLSLSVGSAACHKRIDPAAPETGQMPEGKSCPATSAMISDGESANKTSFQEGRGGWWYTYFDFE